MYKNAIILKDELVAIEVEDHEGAYEMAFLEEGETYKSLCVMLLFNDDCQFAHAPRPYDTEDCGKPWQVEKAYSDGHMHKRISDSDGVVAEVKFVGEFEFTFTETGGGDKTEAFRYLLHVLYDTDNFGTKVENI